MTREERDAKRLARRAALHEERIQQAVKIIAPHYGTALEAWAFEDAKRTYPMHDWQIDEVMRRLAQKS